MKSKKENSLFNPEKANISIGDTKLKKIFGSPLITSYVLCRYENLKSTLNTIAKSHKIRSTINSEIIYNSVNSTDTAYDCIIAIEGVREDLIDFINTHLREIDDEYSINVSKMGLNRNLVSMAKNIKLSLFKKFLWNKENIKMWFEDNYISLPVSHSEGLIQDWDVFRSRIFNKISNDLELFLDSCTEESKERYLKALGEDGYKLLSSPEARKDLKRALEDSGYDRDFIMVRDPIVKRIYTTKEHESNIRKELSYVEVIGLSLNRLANLQDY